MQEEKGFQLNTPVALFIFKRPDLTQQVFNAIAQAKPPKLFVIADGPRNPEEAKLCAQARSVIQQVDWDCQVLTDFSEENMKGPWRISSGLDWVFSEVEEAIVLEDDCLPSPSFFQFCQTLLEYYRHDERIMHISGNNFQFGNNCTNYSYYFSKYTHTWGWATWQRAWKHFCLGIPSWPEFYNCKLFEFICDNAYEYDYFRPIMEKVYTEQSVHWDYAWQYTCWNQGGLSILPSQNLVSNIGFRSDASHTRDPNSPFSNISTEDIWKIQHPKSVVRHKSADIFTFAHVFGGRQRETIETILFQTLKESPRYTPMTVNFFGTELDLVDSASFLSMYQEIFKKEIYRFEANNPRPRIIDGGANIGLTLIYFKQLYPDSCIIAFEPDRQVFNTLNKNMERFGFSGIELVNKALWNTETVLEFMAEGADAGRLVELDEEQRTYKVPTVSLRDYLQQPVDFLKIDIEGAETEVLEDCQDLLCNVKRAFIEFHSFVSRPQTLHKVTKILHDAGFRLHVQPVNVSPQPLYALRTYLGMDMQLNVFAFRDSMISLGLFNFIVFPDWSQDEEAIGEELAKLIVILSRYPKFAQITLFVSVNKLNANIADELLSSVVMMLSLQESLDLEGKLDIQLLEQERSSDWAYLSPNLTAKITLECEDQTTALKFTPDQISSIKPEQINQLHGDLKQGGNIDYLE